MPSLGNDFSKTILNFNMNVYSTIHNFLSRFLSPGIRHTKWTICVDVECYLNKNEKIINAQQ